MKSPKILLTLICLIALPFSCKVENNRQLPVVENQVHELKKIEVNNEFLHYLDLGKGDPIVFVHGTISDYRVWEAQFDFFSQEYRVIAYSRRYAYPNQQNFALEYDFTPNIHSDDLIAFLDSLSFDKVHLVGHSYGAYTSLLAAIKNPQKIKSLVIGEPPVLSLLNRSEEGRSVFKDLINKKLSPAKSAFEKGNNERGLSLFVGAVSGDSLMYSKVSEEIRTRWKDNLLELWGYCIKQNHPTIDISLIKEIHIPTLIIKGEHSPPRFEIINNELKKLLPNNIYYELPESSHGLQTQNSKEFNERVIEFINGID